MTSLRVLGLIFLLLLIVLIVGRNMITKKSVKSPLKELKNTTQQRGLKVLGWTPYWDQENAFASFQQNTKAFDFISVFWYRIDGNGKLTTYQSTVEDQTIIDYAHANGVKVLAIVANMPDYSEGGDWDQNRVDKVIYSKEARQEHIEELVDLVRTKNFDGINIDYEALRRRQRENFSLFIEELADALHREGKILAVAIHPKTGEFKPQEDNGSHAQDLAKISNAADQLHFMTYLENGTFSEAGPPGSIGWIRRVMNYALNEEGIAPKKAYLGIGLMGVEWDKTEDNSSSGNREDIPFNVIESIIAEYGSEVQWDMESQTPFFEYEADENNHVIWFENAQSVSERIKLAKELGVGGIAFWRLGNEDMTIWKELNN